MKKIYYLSTCNTCKRIMNSLNFDESFARQDLKQEGISAQELDELAGIVGSYEALFSRVARKYRALGLHEQTLSEADYKRYILQEYTFLKRPLVRIDEEVFVGSSKKNIAALEQALST